MTKTCVGLSGLFVAVASLGCSSDSPPCAAVTQDVTLLDSPLTHMQKVSLIRAGDSFTLAGYDSGWVRWGRLSLDGKTLTEQTGFALDQPLVGPVFAATTKASPGDQLVAIVLMNSTTPGGGYDLSAIVQTTGPATATSTRVLANYPAGTIPNSVQITAGAATSGNVGFVAWGVTGMGVSPQYLLLQADAVSTSPASKMFDDSIAAKTPNWDCLATTNGTTGLGFSVVAPDSAEPTTSDFDTVEIDEATGNATSMLYQFRVTVANCQVVGSPGPAGTYVIALESSNAIDSAMYYPPVTAGEDGSVTTNAPVLSAASFGDPMSMPHPAWASPAGGGDISFGLAHTAGLQVFRYTYDAIPHGSPLTLRSEKGQIGPVASWVGSDAVYVTYADQAKSGTPAVKRYFMRIESPALP